MLPTFIIIGAQKCGTTSLAAYLATHPELFVSRPKETQFFSHHWREGLSRYERHFVGAEHYTAAGEACPNYTKAPHIPDVPERIARLLPDTQLVYLVRNPLDRIRSAFRDALDRGIERRPTLAAALEADPSYVDISRYAYQLDRYLQYFERSRILVVSTDRLQHRRVEVLREVFAFLGVGRDFVPPNLETERNTGASKGQTPSYLTPLRALWRGMAPVTGRLPSRYRRAMRRRLSRRIPVEQVALTTAQQAAVWSALGNDLRRLRQIVGDEFDLWGRA